MVQPDKVIDSLSDVRVLDFTGELGPYAGKLYAGLGADVIHIETVSGDPLRQVSPFYGNEPGRERSLQYLYYNAGKRGMVLDLKKKEGLEIFVELSKHTDVLLESFTPGYLDSLGLSYNILSAHNPRLVQTSITHFGQFGPYSNMPGSDLVCSALGGFLDLAGTGKDKPVRACDNQSYRMAEAYAAVASMFALFYAKKTGVGQSTDVCCIEAVGMALENSAQYYDLEGTIRRGRGKEAGTATTHPCKDGYITIVAIMGKNKRMWEPFVQWMKEEGVEEWQEFDDDKWIDPAFRSSKEGYNTFCRIFERYSSKHEKMYLYEKGQSFRVAITPVSNGKDLLENPQLRDRNFWQTLRHDNLNGEVTYPGAPYEFNNLRWRLGRPAPHFGQHTREILTELGYSNEKIDTLSKEEVVYVG
jgi:benzylsuccinate CoA-transferase BbsE subunit/naphthyl-2-methylsuccinate CoA transferase subunit